jgi:hypothetical protein
MPENNITRIISGINGLGLLAAVVYLVAIDRAEHVSTVVAIGFAVIGMINSVLPSILGKGPKVPPLPVLLVLMLLVAGCGGSRAQQHERLNMLTDVADPTYAMALEACDGSRDIIVVREGTTYEEDTLAMDAVDERCDPIVAGFEVLRGTQLTARGAIERGAQGAVREAIVFALSKWAELQALIPQLLTLGRSSGGEQ